jgi:hypothetical protein
MTIRINPKWVVLTLFLVIELVLVYEYNHHSDRDRATIAFGATVVGAAFGLYTYMKGIDEKRAETAHLFMARWTAPEMVQFRLVLLDILEHRVDPMDLVRTETDQSIKEKRCAIVSILNFLEEVSIAVHRRAASEDRLQDFYSIIVQQSYGKLEPWIKRERSTDNAPGYYAEFQKLAERWSKG